MSDAGIHRFEEEIRYLRSLLEENGIEYDFEAFLRARREGGEPSQMVPIDITPETAKFFFSSMRHRGDAYGTKISSGPLCIGSPGRQPFSRWRIVCASYRKIKKNALTLRPIYFRARGNPFCFTALCAQRL